MTDRTRNRITRSLALVVLAWLVLQVGGLFTPGLLDDVDSVYLEIAREMLHRHDYVTPYIDGIRFFDKPPLMYWLAAGAMRVFGEHDWAGRIPLALAVLALLLAVYALGLRLYRQASPDNAPDRGAFYAAIVLATSIGPYLYTRFYIPDIVIALWMTLSVHLFLITLDRLYPAAGERKSPLLPATGFAATLALNLLTKGFIGLVFPLGFILLYVFFTRQTALLRRLPIVVPLATFLVIALPWHILAAVRNPAIAMPPEQGLPARAGWAWFYLYNEHVARAFGHRIPQDYGNTPQWLFLLYALIWIAPWAAFLPAAILRVRDHLGHHLEVSFRQREAALTVTLWSATVLVFFCIVHRQEYYSLPALPALALMLGGTLAAADRRASGLDTPSLATLTKGGLTSSSERIAAWVLGCHRWLLLPVASLVAVVCAYFAILAPRPQPGTDLASLLASNPELYNLSLGHLFDLTGAAMGLFRGPLTAVAAGMVLLGLVSFHLRRSGRTYAANLALAGGMVVVLLATHAALVRFNPILGSKPLADAIVREQQRQPRADDLILLDGELTSGSTLLFYSRQPVRLVNGRVNGPWFGSFWPDAPRIFEDEASLRRIWAGQRRVFLLTYTPESRRHDLAPYGPVRVLAQAGGKSILIERNRIVDLLPLDHLRVRSYEL